MFDGHSAAPEESTIPAPPLRERTYSNESLLSQHQQNLRRRENAAPPVRTRSSSPDRQPHTLPIRRRSGEGLVAFNSSAGGASSNGSKSSFLWQCVGKSHLVVLFTGMMLGYLLLPLLMIEVQLYDFLDHFPDASLTHQPQQQASSAIADHVRRFTSHQSSPGGRAARVEAPVVREQNYFLRTESRALEGVQTPLLDTKGNDIGIAEQISDIEKRLIQDHAVLSSQSMPTATTPYIMKTKVLPDHHRMKILITGGAGFVGSHLVDKLMMEGHEVIVVDNFFTGQKKNIAHWLHHPLFSVIVHDVTEPIQLEVDQIYHLACPASPPHYQYNPVKTIKTSTMGTLNMLGLAKRVRARILLTSTSEIYGDPEVHPQPESYWGNVNTIGPRSCYDEGKRVAETMMYSYKNQNNVEIRVARIFNTFGPRMHPNDGRVVSNFIIQALQNKNMTIYGNGSQTRSFQYVSDLVNGLHKLMNGKYDQPVNLGNPEESTVKDFATYIKDIIQSESSIIHLPKSTDDPQQRKPDITTAKREIGWAPEVKVKDGLENTITYFSRVLKEAGEIIPTGPGAAKPEA